jgi:hypothetical protein
MGRPKDEITVTTALRFADRQMNSNKAARKCEIRSLETSEFARWDEFVRQSPQGTLFHTTLWLEATGVPFRLLGYFRGEELRGGFALSLAGRRAAGMAHPGLTPYLGILYPRSLGKYVTELSNNKEVGIAFAAFLTNEFKRIDIAFAPEVIDLMPFRWQGFTARVGYTYRLSLKNIETVFNNMATGRRNDIVTAEKLGVLVESGADFGAILRMHEKTYERQRLKSGYAGTVNSFENALARANRCKGFLARSKAGEPLAAVWIVWDEKRAYYLLSGYDHAVKSRNAVALALWRAIQFTALDLQLPEFDFEGSVIPQVEQFVRKFGGTLTPFYSVQYRRPTILTQSIAFGRRIAGKCARIVLKCG